MKLLVEREWTGKEAAFKGGQGEFEIVGIEFACFLHSPRAWAGPKADVPHPLDNPSYGSLGRLLGLLVAEGEQHVNVGVGEQILTAIATEGEQGDILRRLAGEGPPPHFNEDTVNHSRAAADRGRTVSGTLTGLADERHLPEILIP